MSARRRSWHCSLKACFLVLAMVSGCGPTPDEAVGRNSVLEKQLEEKKSEIAELKAELAELRTAKERLGKEQAATTGAKGLAIEERQKLLDDREVALNDRENELAARQQSVETTLANRKDELEAEHASRTKDVLARELNITQKESEFYKRTNLTMEDIGAAKEVRSEYENMRSARDAAVTKAEDWLRFVWYVSIALGFALLLAAILAVVTISKHITAQRELVNRQEVAKLLSRAIEAQLPPEQGAMVVDAFNRLSRIEIQRPPADREPLPTN